MPLNRNVVSSISGALALSLTATIAVRAHQGRGGGAPAGPTLIPMTASSLTAHPELYLGQIVAMTASVAKSVSSTVFTVDQGKAKIAADILVISPTLLETPKQGEYITVIGEAVKLDPATIAAKLKGYTLTLPPDVMEKYRGKAVVLATSILTPSMADIAKKKPVPATPAEEAFDQVMKKVNPAVTGLRAGLTASDAAAVKKSTAELRTIFTETQAFFKTRGTIDAQGWAGDALKYLDTIDTAATGAKWPDATAATTSLNGLCTSCHTAHRERLDDGTYRVKG